MIVLHMLYTSVLLLALGVHRGSKGVKWQWFSKPCCRTSSRQGAESLTTEGLLNHQRCESGGYALPCIYRLNAIPGKPVLPSRTYLPFRSVHVKAVLLRKGGVSCANHEGTAFLPLENWKWNKILQNIPLWSQKSLIPQGEGPISPATTDQPIAAGLATAVTTEDYERKLTDRSVRYVLRNE